MGILDKATKLLQQRERQKELLSQRTRMLLPMEANRIEEEASKSLADKLEQGKANPFEFFYTYFASSNDQPNNFASLIYFHPEFDDEFISLLQKKGLSDICIKRTEDYNGYADESTYITTITACIDYEFE